ncbi:MAG TPA: FG-GAP-like repeat-containing protein, partial [Bryobacteraceae bacterium]
NAAGTTTSIWLGNGDGTFTLSQTFNVTPAVVVVGDFNGDGNADLAIVNNVLASGATLTIYLGNGDATFRGPFTSSPGPIYSVVAGDFNGDGKDDLATGDLNMSALISNGDGTFAHPENYTSGANIQNDIMSAIVVGDVNGDGKLDVIVSYALSTVMSVYYGLGDGSFQSAVSFPVPLHGASSGLSVGDFNLDGRTDFALVGTSLNLLLGALPPPPTVALTSSVNPSGFGQGIIFTATVGATNATGSVTFYDGLNSIGTQTLVNAQAAWTTSALSVGLHSVTATYSGDGIYPGNTSAALIQVVKPATVTTLTSSPNPSTYGQNVTLTATLSPAAATGNVSFYNGTALLGISPLVNGTASIRTTLLPSGTQSLTARYDGSSSLASGTSPAVLQSVKPVSASGFQTGIAYARSPIGFAGVVVGDFNGDGKQDIAMAGETSVSVVIGNGDGTFRTAVNYPIGTGASAASYLVAADFNGDGVTDLAISGSDPWIYILLGNGDGTFRNGTPVLVLTGVSSLPLTIPLDSIVAADFNGDGNADLAVANYTQSTAMVLLGNGDGTFQSATAYPAGTQSTTVVVGDVNGDGHPDLVVGNAFSNSISVFLGNPDGTFQNALNYPMRFTPFAIALADFNGDGKLDMALSNAGQVSVLLGNGNGTFQPPVSFPAGAVVDVLLAADLDGDNKIDLLVGDPSGAISLLYGNGDGTFQAPVSYTVSPQTRSVALGDFNGDGRVDLALGGATLTVLLAKPSLTGEPLPASRAGVFRNNVAFLEDSNGNETYDAGIDRFIPNFTGPGGFLSGDIPVVGDWTGDGNTKAGIYRASTGTWYLDANNNGILDAGDFTYNFGGIGGDMPFVGDWMGTGKSCIGIYRTGSLWLLDLNCNGSFDDTPTDAFFPYGGLAGDVPVVGAWVGGATRVGVVRKYAPAGVPIGNPFFWVPDAAAANAGNQPANHPPDVARCFAFGGLAGDVFVTGDWYGTGVSQAGVYRAGYWVLDAAAPGTAQSSHTAGFAFGYGGLPGDIPVVGKW